ncbi:metallopeptidase [Stipitochalara longipes BDJ]|nr:metallopeptidase [Stipitochalara longipes BDJ]
MATLTFHAPPQLPVAFTHTPSDLIHLTTLAIESSRCTLNALAQQDPTTATFANTMLPYMHDRNICINSKALTGFYRHTGNSSALRAAALETRRMWAEHEQAAAAKPELYALFLAVQEQHEDLTPDEQHVLDKTLWEFESSGAGLSDGLAKERFQVIAQRTKELEIEALNNIQQEQSGIWFSAEELEGFPRDALDCLGRGGTNVDVDLCLKNCVRAETRKRAFIGNENKCPENVVFFNELVVLRAEAAELLGYPSFADLHIRDGLMTARSVDAFIAEQLAQLVPKAKQEMTVLQKLKREHLLSLGAESAELDDRIFLWDQKFYIQIMEEKQNLDQTKLAEFFPLEVTIGGMLEIFETLFGLVFVELSTEARKELMNKQGESIESMTWDQDVVVYSVWNDDARGGEFLGYLYLDILKRNGKKDHASNIGIQQGFATISSQHHYPSTLLLTSIQRPTSTRPTLVRHRNLVTIFHELGHGIHALVGRTRFASTYGTNIPRDFVEIPSRMLENFCWDPALLQRFSKHYAHLSPKAPLEMLSVLAKSRNMSIANNMLRQLSLAKFDMVIHSVKGPREAANMDLGAVYNSVRAEATGLCGPEREGKGYGWGCGQARFQHMFSGYEAAYYTYALATVYSKDLFQKGFARNLVDREEGARYRDLVLAKGGSRPPREYLEEYLG